MPAFDDLTLHRGRRPKASRERTRGMESAVLDLWGFGVGAWSVAAELLRLAPGNDGVDGQTSLAAAVHAAAWPSKSVGFKRCRLGGSCRWAQVRVVLRPPMVRFFGGQALQ
jgi:hypothetical protein